MTDLPAKVSNLPEIPRNYGDLADKIVELLNRSRKQVISNIHASMVNIYYEVGRMIVEEEQQGKERADYGKAILKDVSERLTKQFGKGYSVDNLQNMRNFYLTYSKYETVSRISDKRPEPRFSG